MSKRAAGTLVGAGLWNLAVWPAFLRRIWRDERSWSGGSAEAGGPKGSQVGGPTGSQVGGPTGSQVGGPTAFLVVHATLTGISMAAGAAVAAIGARQLRAAAAAYPPEESGPVDPQLVRSDY